MAYDENLAIRVNAILGDRPGIFEKRMFGGVGFLVNGNMACGILDDCLIVRVGPDAYDEALSQPHTRVFDNRGRPMTGWVVVSPKGYKNDSALEAWVRRGIDFAISLPGK